MAAPILEIRTAEPRRAAGLLREPARPARWGSSATTFTWSAPARSGDRRSVEILDEQHVPLAGIRAFGRRWRTCSSRFCRNRATAVRNQPDAVVLLGLAGRPALSVMRASASKNPPHC